MIRAPDFAERQRALDPRLSFIVQAPAGSGKTELLIQRYLTLLAHVEHPEEVVAVTFTRKAAAEMRERVLQALAAARRGDSGESEQARLLHDIATAALRRDAQAGWCVAENPARLRIQTIDSLCASLTGQMPMLSRFGAHPATIEDGSDLYTEAARATIHLVESDDAVAADVEKLLVHLDNDFARLESLLASMLARRDHWLRRVYGAERDALESGLRQARQAAAARVCAKFPRSLAGELLDVLGYAAANLITDARPSPVTACNGLCAFPGAGEADVAAWCGIAELLLTAKGEWRKQFDIRRGFPSDNRQRALCDEWKERVAALVSQLAGDEALRCDLHALRYLPPARYSDEQWQVLGAMLRLLAPAVAQLKLAFQVHNRVDFSEVAQAAACALVTDEGPTDLALALDYRIRHLLIDEFQDTSISQYELIARLMAGWQAGDGRTLFVVGDPMQSIYRFRDAEVGLFLRARRNGIAGIKPEPIALRANFRSQAGIVEWVNSVFAAAMPAQEEVASGAVPYTASLATRDALPGAAVGVHAFFDDDHSGEAARVLDIIQAARHDSLQATVAVLVRNRSHLCEIVPQLKKAGLRYRAIEIEGLGEQPVVQDLLALTRALAHPADRMAWLAVLRAPWCGLTLADLTALTQDDRERTLWELMNDAARVGGLSPDGRSRLLQARAVLAQCIGERSRRSLRGQVEGAWLALGGPACVDDATALEDAEVFLDYLEAHDEAGELGDAHAFEEGLAKLHALPDVRADERLQVMTIHKAKGLEFDAVIVPGLGRPTAKDDPALFLWMEQPRENEPDAADLLLAPIRETGAERDPIYDWLRRLEAEKERLEDARLLYVAATRARSRLYLLGATRLVRGEDGAVAPAAPSHDSLLSVIWPALAPEFRRAATAATVPAVAPPRATRIDQRLRRLPSNRELPAAPASARWDAPAACPRTEHEVEFSWVGETARHVGTVVHGWLQRMADDELRGWNAARVESMRKMYRHELLARNVNVEDLDRATERVVLALKRAVADERGRWLLGPQREARNEFRLTAVVDDRIVDLVIDRMFRDEAGAQWIVDYKTSAHEGGKAEAFFDSERERYRAQLERYAAAIGAPATMLGLYFPLLTGWREWRGK